MATSNLHCKQDCVLVHLRCVNAWAKKLKRVYVEYK